MSNTPIVPANTPHNTTRDLMIIAGILVAFLCLLCGLAASAYFVFQTVQESNNAQATAAIATQMHALKIAQATQQAEATAAAHVTATAQAQSTAQAIARATAIAGADLFEAFNDNTRGWRTGEEDSELWQGNTTIEDGVYKWQITNTKEGFIAWSTADIPARDLDLYVDARLISGDPNQVCYGLMYLANQDDLEEGALTFSVCDSQDFSIESYTAENGWQTLFDWRFTPYIRPNDWNQLSVTRRGATYSFYINDQLVGSVNETRLEKGYASIFVTVYETIPGEVWFDNFALNLP